MSNLRERITGVYRYLDFRILQKKYLVAGIIVLSFLGVLLAFEYKLYWYFNYFGISGDIINFGILFFLAIFGVTLTFWGIKFEKN
jgi:hypothetical protein